MKNFDNKIHIIAAIVLGFFGGIAFVNNWLVINKSYPGIDLFKIPFQADVWGTASDWAMVLVTIVTAIYLIKTFRAQQETRRYNNMPNFELVLEDEKYMIRLTNATAFNVRAFKDNLKQTYSIAVWHSYHHAVHAYAQPDTDMGNALVEYSKVEFEDIEGIKYIQRVFHTETVLIIYPPKKIE